MADFPDNIFEGRAVENLPGQTYDAGKTTRLYAEDINNLSGEITAIEETLGTNPEGAFATVKAWLSDLGTKLSNLLTVIKVDSGKMGVGVSDLSTSSAPLQVSGSGNTPLDVWSTTNRAVFRIRDDDTTGCMGVEDGKTYWNQGTGLSLAFARLVLTGSGELGVNCIDPAVKLDVAGDAMRLRTSKTPASASATGSAGTICWDSNYIYVCVATNSWKRVAISTW